jgi:sigma-B regulation protein RsbU (phosphoserine phosphatase)
MPDHPASPAEQAGVDPQAIVPLLRDHAGFARLPEAALATLVAGGEIVEFDAEIVFLRQGDPSDSAYLLLAGEVEVSVETNYGPVPLAILSCPALVGELGVFADLPRTAMVRSRTPLRALRMTRADLLLVGRANPDLLLAVLGQLGQRLATINRAIGFYTHALAALERHDFDPTILDALLHPLPELVDFVQTFRRMAEQIILRRSQHDEMASAVAIQRAMLPAPWLADTGGGRVDLHGEIRPAREVGGDLYDHFMLDDDRLAIVIGDVSGKGVPAALFMAITRTIVRLVARENDDVAVAIRRANELLSADNISTMFTTLFYAVVDLASGRLTYCNCGHNPPLLLRGDGSSEALTLTGLPLGLLAEAEYGTGTVQLAPGDRLFLYTDGVTEANSAAGEEYGDALLAESRRARRRCGLGPRPRHRPVGRRLRRRRGAVRRPHLPRVGLPPG